MTTGESLALGSTGEAVRNLQLALVRLGYALPKWGADGKLGLETMAAIADFAEDHGLPEPVAERDRPLGELVSTILDLAARVPTLPEPEGLHDLTERHSGKHRRGSRPWSQINGIVLHQTAVLLSNHPDRWFDVRTHVGITADGKILSINPPTAVIYHAHAFNRTTLGIEVAGNFEGIEGNPKTWWKPGGGPHKPTDAQLDAARRAVSWLVDHSTRHGAPIRHIFAHRQSSKMRAADPGSRIWQEVGLWAQQELGLDDGGPGYTDGGYPIPREWDLRREEPYRMW